MDVAYHHPLVSFDDLLNAPIVTDYSCFPRPLAQQRQGLTVPKESQQESRCQSSTFCPH
jgi:hypothetical protein